MCVTYTFQVIGHFMHHDYSYEYGQLSVSLDSSFKVDHNARFIEIN